MALPRTITGFAFENNRHIGGPYLVNGSYYVVGGSNSTGLHVYSPGTSTDATWSEEDSGNAPSPTASAGPTGCISSVVDGNNIHIVYAWNLSGPTPTVHYSRFNCSTDTWDTITGGNKYVQIVSGVIANGYADIAVRSDGDIVVVYSDATEKVHGTDYDRVSYDVSTDSGATWAGATYVDGSGVAEHHRSPLCQLGSSDRTHILWEDVGATDTNHVTLNSSDTLQTISAYHSTINRKPLGRASFVSGANTKVAFIIADGSNEIEIFTSADNPSFGTLDDSISQSFNEASVGLVADSGTKLYVGYSEINSDDVFYDVSDDDGGWNGTDTEAEDAVTAIYMSWGYDQTNDKLMWVRGSTLTEGIYNEYSVASGEQITPVADSFTLTDGTLTIRAEQEKRVTPVADSLTLSDGTLTISQAVATTVDLTTDSFTLSDGTMTIRAENEERITPVADSFTLTDGTLTIRAEQETRVTPVADGFTLTDGTLTLRAENETSVTPVVDSLVLADGTLTIRAEQESRITLGTDALTLTDSSLSIVQAAPVDVTLVPNSLTLTDGTLSVRAEQESRISTVNDSLTLSDGTLTITQAAPVDVTLVPDSLTLSDGTLSLTVAEASTGGGVGHGSILRRKKKKKELVDEIVQQVIADLETERRERLEPQIRKVIAKETKPVLEVITNDEQFRSDALELKARLRAAVLEQKIAEIRAEIESQIEEDELITILLLAA